jgi:hypothetical protein
MYKLIILLALLIGLASCNKFDNFGPDDSRSLPSLHTVILGQDFYFPSPTSHADWDATTDVGYAKGTFKVGFTIGLDGRVMSPPVGEYNGESFMVVVPTQTEGATIWFTSQAKWVPIVWEMVP